MKVILEEVSSGEQHEAIISVAAPNDTPLKKEGWQFNWKQLRKTEGAHFFKLSRLDTPKIIEGILMLTLLNNELLFLNNIEVAPHNFGSNGKFANIAGSLIAFACYKSFELGKNHYLGYLAFDSKTNLIKLYEEKYGATHAIGHKMFFTPDAGKKLMIKYLNFAP